MCFVWVFDVLGNEHKQTITRFSINQVRPSLVVLCFKVVLNTGPRGTGTVTDVVFGAVTGVVAGVGTGGVTGVITVWSLVTGVITGVVTGVIIGVVAGMVASMVTGAVTGVDPSTDLSTSSQTHRCRTSQRSCRSRHASAGSTPTLALQTLSRLT